MYLPSIQYFHDKAGDPTRTEFFCQEGKIWGYNRMFQNKPGYSITHLTTGKTGLTKVPDIETAQYLCELLNEEFPDLKDLERLKQTCKKLQGVINKEKKKDGNRRTEREMPTGSGAGENRNHTKESDHLGRDQPTAPGPGRRVITFRRRRPE